MKVFRLVFEAILWLSTASVMASATAQAYPSKPVTLLVPFSPGGPANVVARLLAQKLTPDLGQTMVVDNRPGAGGTIAAAAVAKAVPDGYTLLFVTAGHAGVRALYPSLPFDPVKDFTPVIGLATSPIVIVVNAKSKFRTLKDLVADARARPGKLNFTGGGGGATVTNLAAEVFRFEAKLDAVNIPYKGSGPALTGLVAGETDFAFDSVAAVAGLVKGGKLRALAIASRKRSSTLPDVPPIPESILPDFQAAIWFGILAPRGTPPEVVDRLNRAFNAALRAPDVVARLKDLGSDPYGGTPTEFGKFVEAETSRWGAVIKRLGLKAE